MSNIIRLPKPGSGRTSRPATTARHEGGAEILFFTGVRYSRRGQKDVERAPRRRERTKAKA